MKIRRSMTVLAPMCAVLMLACCCIREVNAAPAPDLENADVIEEYDVVVRDITNIFPVGEEITCESDCNGNGTCVQENVCICYTGYHGKYCEYSCESGHDTTIIRPLVPGNPAYWITHLWIHHKEENFTFNIIYDRSGTEKMAEMEEEMKAVFKKNRWLDLEISCMGKNCYIKHNLSRVFKTLRGAGDNVTFTSNTAFNWTTCDPIFNKGCTFGGEAYSNKKMIQDTCMEFECRNQTWIFTGQTNDICGQCQIFGETYSHPYDVHTVPDIEDVQQFNGSYSFQPVGIYAITQPGYDNIEEYGVNANFNKCPSAFSCVVSVHYYEPDIKVDIFSPSNKDNAQCTENNDDPDCKIKVLVNDEELSIEKEVKSLKATTGTILVFDPSHYNGSGVNKYENTACINVVGSKGLSVAMCLHQNKYAFVNVSAMPSLKYEVYGLCDTFTGNITLMPPKYRARNTSFQTNSTVFAESWKVKEILDDVTTIDPAIDYAVLPTIISIDQDDYYVTASFDIEETPEPYEDWVAFDEMILDGSPAETTYKIKDEFDDTPLSIIQERLPNLEGIEGEDLEALKDDIKTALTKEVVIPNNTINSTPNAASFLAKYGYFDSKKSGTSKEDVQLMILEYQKFNQLELTGQLDTKTLEDMNTPRCGMKDMGDDETKSRRRRSAIQDPADAKSSRWDKLAVTYNISSYSKSSLQSTEIQKAIKDALNMWERVTALKFSPATSKVDGVDIDIKFFNGSHSTKPEDKNFDGVGGTLAHAFYPEHGGSVHFDDAEPWKIGCETKSGTDFVQVAAHEIGHSIGLRHSNIAGTLMAPKYSKCIPNHTEILKDDDISSATALYGQSICKKGCKNGKCIAEKCECDSGWRGQICKTPKCDPEPGSSMKLTYSKGCRDKRKCGECSNHGLCNEPNQCTCDQWWQGSRCQDSKCDPPCQYGDCKPENKCSCNGLWRGRRCKTPMCEPQIGCLAKGNCETLKYKPGCREARSCGECSNHGLCTAPNSCECDLGWKGRKCQWPKCNPQCRMGDCIAPDTCRCVEGWRGKLCKRPKCDSCVNGRCVAPNECVCNKGWQGKTCEDRVCDPTCVYGTCNAETKTCDCKDGWRGKSCKIPSCEPTKGCLKKNKCKECSGITHGKCVGKDFCHCNAGRMGKQCENHMCDKPCKKGTCTGPNICTCYEGWDNGWNGTSCNKPLCKPECKNGICLSPDHCECFLGFIGKSCTEKTKPEIEDKDTENKIVTEGDTFSLECTINNLAGHSVSWIHTTPRHMTISVNNLMLTRHGQFMVKKVEETWKLTITNFKPVDAGEYMCQVNSLPMIIKKFKVEVDGQ